MDLKNAARLAFTHLRIDLKENLQPILHGKYHGLLSFFPSKHSTNRLHPVFISFWRFWPLWPYDFTNWDASSPTQQSRRKAWSNLISQWVQPQPTQTRIYFIGSGQWLFLPESIARVSTVALLMFVSHLVTRVVIWTLFFDPLLGAILWFIVISFRGFTQTFPKKYRDPYLDTCNSQFPRHLWLPHRWRHRLRRAPKAGKSWIYLWVIFWETIQHQLGRNLFLLGGDFNIFNGIIYQ